VSPWRRYTIYTNESPPYTVRLVRPAGRYLLTPTHSPNAPTITITDARLRELRDG
jgi:hypothetical protein